jgi:hypothetical protein
MDRQKIANKLIKYLDKNVNCKNLLSYIDKLKTNEDKILVSDVPISFKTYSFDLIDVNKMGTDYDNLINLLDFMTDSNNLGAEHFPYVYGVLICYENTIGKVHVFSEAFFGSFLELLDSLTHISEWYDIIFQITIIDKYLELDNNLEYVNPLPEQLLFKKYSKPIYKSYTIDSIDFTINHKFLIVIDNMTLESGKNSCNLLKALREWINKYSDKIKIKPSSAVIKLLDDIISSWWTKSTLETLKSVYIKTPTLMS